MDIYCISCKSYADAWVPFGTFFQRFWHDCPYRRTLISDIDPPTNTLMPFFPGHILLMDDNGWIENLAIGLRKNIQHSQSEPMSPTVSVWQEDFFLSSRVPTATVVRLDKFMQESDFDCCRLFPCPGANDPNEIVPGVGLITGYAPYRASCQVAIWKRKSLLTLCDRLMAEGYSTAAHFEMYGSRMIDDFKICGWIREKGTRDEWPVLYLCSAIASGKWMSGAIQFCKEQGVPITGKREILYASGAEEAVLRAGYYEWLAACAEGRITPHQ